MVLQKRFDYGFHGYQIPTMPTGCRSARKKRAIKYAVDPAKLCAIDLLATVAGELLLEKEEDVAIIVTPQEPDDKRPVKVEPCNQGNCDVGVSVIQCRKKLSHKHMFKETNSQASSPSVAAFLGAAAAGAPRRDVISPARGASASPKLEKEEMSAAAASAPTWIGNPSNNAGNLKVPSDQGSKANKAATGKDLMDVDTKPPAPPLASSDSSVEVPATYRSPRNFMRRSSSIPRFQDKSVVDHKGCNEDADEDDGNSSACTHPSTVSPRAGTASSAFRPQRIGDRRIRKLLSSRFWKAGPGPLKEGEFCDRDMFRSKKLSYTRHNIQQSSFKRRKSFERNSVSSSSAGIATKTISKLPSDYNNKSTKGEQGNETSSSISSPKTSFKSEGYQVKLKIKSLKVPELFIEMPETATVGSLKRAVLETVTAMLGNGLKVGVTCQGRKVRDDSRTLVQAGISGGEMLDSLNFSLEPNASSGGASSSALLQVPHGSSSCGAEALPLEQCRSPRPLAVRLPEFRADATNSTVESGACEQQPHPKVVGLASPSSKASSGNADCLADDASGAIVPVSSSLSKALVPVNPSPSSSSGLALAVVPASNNTTRRPETGRRRIRRPFSVAEVEALVQAVEKLGTGRWRDVKLQAFENAKHRTYVDLKDKWKTLVHTARISPQQRRGEPVPQELLDRVLVAHAHWSQHQARLQPSKHTAASASRQQQQPSCLAAGLLLPPPAVLQTEQQPQPLALQPLPKAALI